MHKTVIVAIVLMLVTACNTGESRKKDTADQSATQETVSMLAGLKHAAGEGIMFGHQDDLSYGIGWVYPDGESDVRRVSGDYPAVYGMDLGDIEHRSPVNLDSVPFDHMKTFVRQIWERGGVITFSWHVDNPLTGGNSWDISSDKVVASVLPGGEKHDEFRAWLDNLAEFLGSLRDDQGVAIPVIFRPWHEHTGSWFWWGRKLCSNEEYIALWKMTVHFMRERSLDNLIMAFSPNYGGLTRNMYMERYPGDDYIDLLGLDAYGDGQEFMDILRNELNMVAQLGKEHNKPIALTECGMGGLGNSKWFTQILLKAVEGLPVTYALVWRNAPGYLMPMHIFAPYPGHPSAADFIDFFHNPRTLFLNEI